MRTETDDPVKSKLLSQTARYREELEDDAKEISARTEKLIKNAIIIGGVLGLAYLTYRQFSGSKKKKSKVKHAAPKASAAAAAPAEDDEEEETSSPNKMLSQLGTVLVSQASVFLLSLAKEKLMEYLQSQAEKKKDEHS